METQLSVFQYLSHLGILGCFTQSSFNFDLERTASTYYTESFPRVTHTYSNLTYLANIQHTAHIGSQGVLNTPTMGSYCRKYTSSYSSYSQKLLSSIVRCQSPIPTQTRKNTSKGHYKIDQSQVIEQIALNTTLADRQTKIQSHINTSHVAL